MTQTDPFIVTRCAFGHCTNLVDPASGRIHSGFGPMACPCDHVPGWRSPYPAGQAKPHVPVKATGRHGSRRQRAARRTHRASDYGDLFTYYPPVSRAPSA
ncbi:hypothetical protein [Nocardioides sp. Leaf285]|uniref:hypothetical protein n=1 Tax=Nocardioides sp. Leaf285 TaxID=1736322 RepID=UPI00070350E0|nr:hypothetical protein [Nocardioides sp. Leaf285]KQP62999.1 hypothetical protein ASF47_18480 [Nocardioides sp. Leaf285]